MTRRITFLLTIFLVVLTVLACDDDIDTTADFKDIPVVVGLLSTADTAHYIRVERAFQARNQNANDVAQIPDSIYYDNLTVILEKIETEERFFLEEVDGNLEGYVRDEGTFAQAPNILYKIKADEIGLEAGDEVKLIIIRDDNLPEVTATTTVLGQVNIFSPSEVSRFRIVPNSTNRISWSGTPLTFFYQVDMYISIRELELSISRDETTEYRWSMERRLTAERLNFSGDEFLSFIVGLNMEEKPSIARSITNIRVVVSSGGEEMFQAVNLNIANAGITSTQESPLFSNIEGGQGIFSSRSVTEVTGVGITSESLEVLKENPLTANLNFF